MGDWPTFPPSCTTTFSAPATFLDSPSTWPIITRCSSVAGETPSAGAAVSGTAETSSPVTPSSMNSNCFGVMSEAARSSSTAAKSAGVMGLPVLSSILATTRSRLPARILRAPSINPKIAPTVPPTSPERTTPSASFRFSSYFAKCEAVKFSHEF